MAHSTEHRFPLHAQARACRSLVLALACIGAATHLHAQAPGASPAAEAARGYGIPAGPLEDALNRFGRDSGLLPGSYVLRAVRTTAPAAAATLAEVRVTSTARRAMPC